ncbi:MAG: class I SAM-dependent methyltransferase [Candidatus Paceibacterota bacterium]|jgi:SAM-dependent methyltransferase
MLSKVISELKPREDWNKYFKKNTGLIIDLGCGHGADSYFLAERGYKVIAVDEANNLKFQHPNLIFIQQKLETLVDDKFDGVIANFSLHFLESEKRLKVIEHYLKNLKPEGIFYILTFEEFVTPEFLKLFPQEPVIEYYTKEDDHPPVGKHTHHIAKIVYQK